jgi:hypothetical protein
MDTTKDWQFGKTLPDRINYMLQNELMCDVTFHVGANQTPIKAHKFMLASASHDGLKLFDDEIPRFIQKVLQSTLLHAKQNYKRLHSILK